MSKRKSTHQSGMAGEFFVMEALFRLGHEPALTLGNAKTIDILVQNESGETLKISVKTVRGGGKWGVGTEDLSKNKKLFFIFLHYKNFDDVTTRPDVFIVPARDVQKIKEDWFNSFAVYFSNSERRERLEKYRDAWNLLAN